MTEPLFEIKSAPQLRPLTRNQPAIYAYVCSVPGGVTADEVGAWLHERQGKHSADQRCDWCATAGKHALATKAIRQRVVRHPGGLYEPRNVDDRAVVEPVQIDQLPGAFFEDLFESAA